MLGKDADAVSWPQDWEPKLSLGEPESRRASARAVAYSPLLVGEILDVVEAPPGLPAAVRPGGSYGIFPQDWRVRPLIQTQEATQIIQVA